MNSFPCQACGGTGTTKPYANVAADRCLICRGTGDLVVASLFDMRDSHDRIAAALEVIASDITERNERERAALVSQYRHLQREVQAANSHFSAADNRSARLNHASTDAELKRVGDWLQTCEERCASADADLAAFIAANPGIAELAGQS